MMNIKIYVKPVMEIIEFDWDVRTDTITASGVNDGSATAVPLPGESWGDVL